MPRRILILDAHPDPDPARLIHALAEAYAQGAAGAGHEVRRLRLAELDAPLLRSQREFDHEAPPPEIAAAQADLEWSEHLVLLFPLWLGGMPAKLKGFLEQLLRPGFALDKSGRFPKGRLSRRSVRVVVTMGMPALAYRWWYGAHALRALERSILGFAGLGPIRRTLLGMVDAASQTRRAGWLAKLRALGAQAR